MQFDADNAIVKLCTQGMNLEGEGKMEEAHRLFRRAWDEATTNFEKFISAHYLARHQKGVTEKLKWDQTALNHAFMTDDEAVREALPSLYLNIGKCYEDLDDFGNAQKNYETGLSYCMYLKNDGYGKMIRGGIMRGIGRLKTIKTGSREENTLEEK